MTTRPGDTPLRKTGARLVAIACGVFFNAVYLEMYFDFGRRWEEQIISSGRLSLWWLFFFLSVSLNAAVWTLVLMFMEGQKGRSKPVYWISMAADLFVLYTILVTELVLSDPMVQTKVVEITTNLRLLLLPIAALWAFVSVLRRELMTKLSTTESTPDDSG